MKKKTNKLANFQSLRWDDEFNNDKVFFYDSGIWALNSPDHYWPIKYSIKRRATRSTRMETISTGICIFCGFIYLSLIKMVSKVIVTAFGSHSLTSSRTLNHIKQFMLVNSFWVSVAVPSFEVEEGVRMVR